MTKQKMPSNLNAERSLLGSFLIDSNLINSFSDQISASDFYEPAHAIIFDALVQLKKNHQDIDPLVLSDYLTSIDQLNKVGGLEYILDIQQITPSLAHVDTYVDMVRSTAAQRNIIMVSNRIAEAGLSGKVPVFNQITKRDELVDITHSNDLLDFAERQVIELSRRRKIGGFKDIGELMDEVNRKIEIAAKNSSDITGLQTGYSGLDEVTSGFQNDDLIIIAARPAMGKSALVMNIATHVAELNKASVGVFSLEMSNEQLGQRMIASLSNVSSSKIRTAKNLTPIEWGAIRTAITRLKGLKFYFDDSSISNIGDIRAKCRKLKMEGKLDMVVIDYLQLISDSTKTGINRQEEVSRISRSLKQMARELSVPVIALSQLGRDVETRKDKRPILSDLRESGAIEQDADMVMFLHSEDYYDPDKFSNNEIKVDLIVSKNRHGATKDIELLFFRNVFRFSQTGDPE